MKAYEHEHQYIEFSRDAIGVAVADDKLSQTVELQRNTIYGLDGTKMYVRLREIIIKRQRQVLLTVKPVNEDGMSSKEEYEIEVSNLGHAQKILQLLGLEKRYIVEKIRETWKLADGCEIVFDRYPGLDEIMELEAPTRAKLAVIEKRLRLTPSEFGVKKLYTDKYGIDSLERRELTFKNAAGLLGPRVRKHKTKFMHLSREQRRMVNTLLDRSQ